MGTWGDITPISGVISPFITGDGTHFVMNACLFGPALLDAPMRSGNSPQDQPFFWGVSPGYRTRVLTWQCLSCDKTFTITSSMKLPKMTFGHFLKVVGFLFSR